MKELNCWEYHKCGKEVGGAKVDNRGPCPASTFSEASGFLRGHNGGRACAFIDGTFCNVFCQETKRMKKRCNECGFYRELKKAHGDELNRENYINHVRTQLML